MSIARYLSQLETADRHGDAEVKVERLKGKIEKLKEDIVQLNAINAEMMKSEDKQISLSDPDARSMATSGKDTVLPATACRLQLIRSVILSWLTNQCGQRSSPARTAGRPAPGWLSRRSRSLLIAATTTAKRFVPVRKPASRSHRRAAGRTIPA